MGIGSRIREARLACHYTQEELAGLLGVSKGAVANYENGLHTPKEAVLCRLIPALQVDANFLFQDVEGMPRKNPALTQEELRFLEKLRRLSSYDRETLFYLMDRQLMALPERAPETLSQTPAAPSLPPEEPPFLPLHAGVRISSWAFPAAVWSPCSRTETCSMWRRRIPFPSMTSVFFPRTAASMSRRPAPTGSFP